MSRDQRRILSKFRSCNLPLAIETGRYTRPKTPVNDRVCQFCDMDVVEDETHFLIDCNFYSDLRYDLFRKTMILNINFNTFNSIEKLKVIMNDNSLQFCLANTLLNMFSRRKHSL